MQWFDAEAHATFPGIGDERLDGLGHHRARRRDVTVWRRSTHQHQHIGVEGGGFFDGTAVVVDAGGPFAGSGRREHAAPAQPRHVDARIPHHPHRIV